jgi:DNA-binding SARP family transcriptional activator
MWFSLLGPLQVESQGTQRPVPAAKQRALLAALAVSANNVVPADMLAEAMWGGNAPPSKVDTTRTYVHRLRSSLGQEAGSRIVAQPPGYMLRVDPSEIDLLRFESLIKEGRACVETDAWPDASALLSEAEALWRGTPFADIQTRPQHDRYVRYLEQTRLMGLELRFEADVRMSRWSAAATIPELQNLALQHPERERLCLLLMLALYRASRQTEALSVFADARSFSIAEYGVDPGPELAEMHKRILAQDPGLLNDRLDRFYFALPARTGLAAIGAR